MSGDMTGRRLEGNPALRPPCAHLSGHCPGNEPSWGGTGPKGLRLHGKRQGPKELGTHQLRLWLATVHQHAPARAEPASSLQEPRTWTKTISSSERQ